MTRLLRLLVAALAALALALSLAACGDDDGKEDADDEASAGTTDGASAATDDPAGDDGTVSTGGPDGGTDDGDAAAGTDEFCDAFANVYETSATISQDVTAASWKTLQDSYVALGEVGVPEDATAEQAEGLTAFVETITGISFAEAKRLFATGGEADVDPADEAKIDAFLEYASTTCVDALGAGPDDSTADPQVP